MLTELPYSEVNNLCKILRTEWPQTVQAINFVRTCSEWKKRKPSVDMSILYDKDNIQSGTFVLVNKSGCFAPIVSMYALDSYENNLEDFLSTFLENCDGKFRLSLISAVLFPILEEVITAKACEILYSVNLIIFSMDIDEAKNLEINYPPDVEIKSLKKEHLKDIYDVWVLKEIHNLEELENCLELNNECAVGIFCKQTGRVLCRCLRSHNGAISALQTIEEARGKGYAKLLLKHVSKKLAEMSIAPYTYVADFNEISIKTIARAGFRIVGQAVSADIQKSEYH